MAGLRAAPAGRGRRGRCGARGAPRGPGGGRCGLREGGPSPPSFPRRGPGPDGGAGRGGGRGRVRPRGGPAFVRHHGRGPRRRRGGGPAVRARVPGAGARGGPDAGRFPPGKQPECRGPWHCAPFAAASLSGGKCVNGGSAGPGRCRL